MNGYCGVEYLVCIGVINGILLSVLAAQRKYQVHRISEILTGGALSPASGELFS